MTQSDNSNSNATRFSGLINPIRDLALNWDVDIAHTLEDYLEELEHIRLPQRQLLDSDDEDNDSDDEGDDGRGRGGSSGRSQSSSQSISQSSGGGGTSSRLQSLNFAEAALLIQGSTCVYSKKVEHLHNLVFQALQLITQGNNSNSSNKEVKELGR
jgi:condensin-2 complex subunit H2